MATKLSFDDRTRILNEVRARMGTAEWAGINVELIKGRLVFSNADPKIRDFPVDPEWWEQSEHERNAMLTSVLRQLGKRKS